MKTEACARRHRQLDDLPRAPLRVRQEWARESGLVRLVGPEFDARLEVGTAESQVNPANDVLRRGCERLGYQEGRDYARIERNARGCQERCRPCAFGCPFNAKRSSLVTYLADAVAAGARLLCETEALHLEVEGGRVRGVTAAHRTGPTVREIDVRAPTVILCGGAIETPRLLLRSGLGGRAAGRGLHLHPTAAVLGEFARPIEMWNGPMQSILVSRFQETDEGHGPWIENAPAHPGLAALALPWTGGADHKARMRRVDHAAASIALVRDVGSGRVRLTASGGVRIDYALTRRDRENLVRGMVETARIHRAAGARRIATLHQQTTEVGDGERPIPASQFDQLIDRIERLSVRPNDPLLFSAHPTGGAAIGNDERRAVAGPDGAVFGVDGLWIGDGSALPTAPGVNPMLSILVVARGTAEHVDRRLGRPGSSPERPSNVRKAL